MKEITGKEYDAETLMNEWIHAMANWEIQPTEAIQTAYLQHLYRQEGWHTYVEREVSVAPTAIAQSGIEGAFMAEIAGITPQGELILRTENNEEKTYHFKQIRFVI